MEVEVIALGAALLTSIVGWISAGSKNRQKLSTALKDIQALQERVDRMQSREDARNSEEDLKAAIERIADHQIQMDQRRDSARTEVSDFRERISREIAAISAKIDAAPLCITPKREKD
jgi:outer membrane murein-binding lipoprotein Lpp